VNNYYKLHKQVLVQVVPMNGKLTFKVYQPHHYDPIQVNGDVENAVGYIISPYDKSNESYEMGRRPAPATGVFSLSEQNTRNYEQSLQGNEKENQSKKTYAVWTDEYNFIMDTSGQIISNDDLNQLGFLPFVEISEVKEYEYWVRDGSPYSDFTVEFNTRMSEAAQVVKMQGFAQAWYKGNKEALLQSVKIGPNYVLKLPVDKENNIETDFGFATPNADISGTIEYLKVVLFMFLSSQSIDSAISTDGNTEQYASGFERLISMIDRAMVNKDDFDTFAEFEVNLFELIKKLNTKLSLTKTLEESFNISDSDKISVNFKKPQAVKTDIEEWELIERQMPYNTSSVVDYIATKYNVSREEAIDKIKLNTEDNAKARGEVFENESEQGRGESGNKSSIDIGAEADE
jgi:hypothetical protein